MKDSRNIEFELLTMKLLIFVCTIFVLSYIHLSEGECDDTLWVAVPNIEMKKIHGRWYSVLRFANGDDDNSDCLWHDVKAHPSIPGAVTDAVRRTFKTGKGHAKKTIDGAVSLSKAGKFHHEYQKGATVDTVVVDIDYDEYALLRACYGDDGKFVLCF